MKEKNERNRNWDPNPATLDHLVTTYELYGSCNGPILKPPTHPQGDCEIYSPFSFIRGLYFNLPPFLYLLKTLCIQYFY